jgi:magnesium transporter
LLIFCLDWIAHGILDSIVDQFFPLLNSIEREVKDFDDLVLSINGPLRNRRELGERKVPPVSIIESKDMKEQKLNFVDAAIDEKSKMEYGVAKWSLRFARPFSWGAFYIRRLISTSPVGQLKQWSRHLRRPKVTSSSSPLIPMASTRRLVTSLARLLGTKSEVVSQIRKRLSGNGFIGLEVSSSEQALVGEVGVYLGDIQGFPSHPYLDFMLISRIDHILTLQQSLAHYERMLSHSHPAYLSHIRVSLAQAKAGMDHKLFMLTVLAVSILVRSYRMRPRLWD